MSLSVTLTVLAYGTQETRQDGDQSWGKKERKTWVRGRGSRASIGSSLSGVLSFNSRLTEPMTKMGSLLCSRTPVDSSGSTSVVRDFDTRGLSDCRNEDEVRPFSEEGGGRSSKVYKTVHVKTRIRSKLPTKKKSKFFQWQKRLI